MMKAIASVFLLVAPIAFSKEIVIEPIVNVIDAGAILSKEDAESHVQTCGVHFDYSGQGYGYEAIIEVNEGECKVVYQHGFEYGNETGYRGMYNISPLSTEGSSCEVAEEVFEGHKVQMAKIFAENPDGEIEEAGNCPLVKGGE